MGFFCDFAFLSVEVARADDDDVARLSFRLETHKIDEF